jgi:tRNA (mo5U34)-methyltransferase
VARVHAAVAAHPESELRWYHTIDLGDGRVTNGHFDTRAVVERVPLPADLRGRTCLDVGTWDGFWAFEMERRGAASVTAIDIDDPREWDWPATAAPSGIEYLGWFKANDEPFRIAREALGSGVERRLVNVYDLDPAEHGVYDVVFIGSLLLHLRDPVRALERVRQVTRGHAVIVDTVDVGLSLLRPRRPAARLDGQDRPWWWTPNVAALREMVRRAGFRIEATTGLFFVPLGTAHPPVSWRESLVVKLRGVPHAGVLAATY